MSESCCRAPNPQPRKVGQNVDVVCLNCKLTVSERQLWLVLAWQKKLAELRERNEKLAKIIEQEFPDG